MSQWTPRQSAELYHIDRWGDGYFSVGDNGHLNVHPRAQEGPAIDLLSLVGELKRRGLRTPLLIRFSDLIDCRIRAIAGAFAQAIEELDYTGRWRGVYPIKVNQQRHVVEEIVQFGAAHGLGLEAGSKPELLVALAVLDTPEALIVCNGYKDRAYVETALLAQRLGRHPVIVVDRYRELELIIKTARELGIKPHIGMRARLSSVGSGRWVESSGQRSKFGLSPDELVDGVGRLRAEDMLDSLELLHFHIGSQITSIRSHKAALREASRIYVGLHELGATGLCMLDVGGGLGIDYDGSNTDSHSSRNYSEQEYANDVVFAIQEACDEARIPAPDIVTESGRATVAHHSALIFDVIGANQVCQGRVPEALDADAPKILRDLRDVCQDMTSENVVETYHDLMQLRDEAAVLFSLGHLDLSARARAEQHFVYGCERILSELRTFDEIPEELFDLEKDLADTYFGNFSVFQSAPDHWAVKQLFPVLPIHRLDEEPTRRAVLADLTCDSDGRMDTFIGLEENKKVLELHPWTGEDYYLGVFLVGAYQEILGDLHNLFGDTDAVHVRLDGSGGFTLEHVVEGDEVSDVLSYVQYEGKHLVEKVRRTIEEALRAGRISLEESALLKRRYQQGLSEYTYLTDDE